MKIFELFGSISLKGGAETKGEISDIDKRAVQMGQNMRKAGAAMTAAGGLMVGTAAKIVGSYAKAGDEINKMALRTGVSEDALSRWRVAAQRSGTDLVAVETGVKRMQRSIIGLSDGLAENTRSFARLNLNLEDLQDLKPEEQLRLIMARMADIEDPTLRAATAQEILGRSGTALLPALENGAKGLEDLMKVAEETGEVFDKEAAKAAAEYQDSMRDMWGAITGLVRVFAVELMPVLREVIERVKDAAVGAREWIEDNRELVAGLSRFALIAGGILSVL
ncbi:MAG: phage tail tape measure protein, partial [Sulfurimonas sp.]|uniref:phage tail tape measure protein n=1 Tax=Sulfurimonas sp. TaxID=2022749 RepID=UPI0025CF1CBA